MEMKSQKQTMILRQRQRLLKSLRKLGISDKQPSMCFCVVHVVYLVMLILSYRTRRNGRAAAVASRAGSSSDSSASEDEDGGQVTETEKRYAI